MKMQHILALSFSLLLTSACQEMIGEPNLMLDPNRTQMHKAIKITSIYPPSAISGSEIAIYGENFGKTISDNYVKFNYPGSEEPETGWVSEVIQVPHTGIVMIRVPQHLNSGEYTISLYYNGQSCNSPQTVKVFDPIAKI